MLHIALLGEILERWNTSESLGAQDVRGEATSQRLAHVAVLRKA